jgi:hypothetical protein
MIRPLKEFRKSPKVADEKLPRGVKIVPPPASAARRELLNDVDIETSGGCRSRHASFRDGNEIEEVGKAVFEILRKMDSDCPKGLCDFVSQSPYAGRKKKDEAAITWGITKGLQNGWQVEQQEFDYPGDKRRCDRVVQLKNGSRLWLEIKLSWRAWWSSCVVDNKPFFYHGYFTGANHKHSLAGDFRKLAELRGTQTDYVSLLLVGFDRSDSKMAHDMVELQNRERLTEKGWKWISDAWPSHQSDECWHRCWFYWRRASALESNGPKA